MVLWSYYNKFENVNDKYLPCRGEGDTIATQIVTAVNKLVYKWYNDGDVFDNTHGMTGWCNDLSSYANWLYKVSDSISSILCGIDHCHCDGEYEDLLKELADLTLNEKFLNQYNFPKSGSIYECDGPFKFEEYEEDEEDEEDDYWDDGCPLDEE